MTDVCRRAVRDALSRAARSSHSILIACSGGADSLALAALAAEEVQRVAQPPTLAACVIDHQLQTGSAEVARAAAAACRGVGIDNAVVIAVEVIPSGEGLEAAARHARQNALQAHATAIGASEIWLAHTLEDQAESVLIGLTHGSGSRSLQGMTPIALPWVRPVLKCRRAALRAHVPASVVAWEDPHNTNPQFLRARVRGHLLPALTDVLGDRAIVNLARTAELLHADNAALDEMAGAAAARCLTQSASDVECDRKEIAVLAPAVQSRVVRNALLTAGCTARDLTSAHIAEVTRLFCEPDINGPIALPGGVTAERQYERVLISRRLT